MDGVRDDTVMVSSSFIRLEGPEMLLAKVASGVLRFLLLLISLLPSFFLLASGRASTRGMVENISKQVRGSRTRHVRPWSMVEHVALENSWARFPRRPN